MPGILYFAVFFYVPLAGNVIAFQDYQPYLGFQQSPFVGWTNFTALLEEPEFWSAVWNTLEISAVQLFLYFPAPIALALFLNSLISSKVRRLMQTVVYLPHFLSWVSWSSGCSSRSSAAPALVSSYLNEHGVHVGNIMANPDTFILLVTAQSIWKDAAGARSSSWPPWPPSTAAVRGGGRGRRRPLAPHVAHHPAGHPPGDRPAADPAAGRHPVGRLRADPAAARRGRARRRPRCSTPTSTTTASIDGNWGMSAAAGLFKGVIGAHPDPRRQQARPPPRRAGGVP